MSATKDIGKATKTPMSKMMPPVNRPRTSEMIARINAAVRSGSERRKKNAGLTSGANAAKIAHKPPMEAGELASFTFGGAAGAGIGGGFAGSLFFHSDIGFQSGVPSIWNSSSKNLPERKP